MKAKLLSRAIKPYGGWLEERFKDHYAQMSVDTTLKLRSAVKDVVRARLGFVPEDVESLTVKIKMPPQGVTDHDFALGYHNDDVGHVPGSSEEGPNKDPALCEFIDRYPDDWETVKRCLGLAKSVGRHASAYVITNEPIDGFVPLTTVSEVRVTAYTANSVEAAGGIKMDFLVINSLSDISGAIKLIQTDSGRRYQDVYLNGSLVPRNRQIPLSEGVADIWDLPEDQLVFDAMADGDTETVFQFATPGVIKWLPHFRGTRPDGSRIFKSISDLAIFTALDRPGPLDYYVSPPGEPDKVHNILVEYSRRVQGLPRSSDIPAVMDRIAPETEGLLIFQEALQRTYQEITGCGGPEAEEFRRDISKKKKSKIAKAYAKFMERATEKLGSQEDAQAIWTSLDAFSQYGFNKSHAISYAYIAYACAYLKYYYPLQWWCAVMSNATKNDIYDKFWAEVAARDIVLLPDIQYSRNTWYIRDGKLQAPLSLLDGVGEKAHAQICAGAPYSSLQDFAQKIVAHQQAGFEKVKKINKAGDEVEVDAWGRSAIHRGVLKNLLISGCMDSIVGNQTIGDSLDAFDAAMKAACKDIGKKYTRPKTQALPLDALSRYQAKKEVLPVWGDDLRPLLPRELPAGIQKEGAEVFVTYRAWDYATKTAQQSTVRCVSGAVLKTLCAENQKWTTAVVAHVDSCEKLNYGPNKEKIRLQLTLDVGGVKVSTTQFQDKSGIPFTTTAGDIVVAVLYQGDRGPLCKSITTIKKPECKGKNESE